MQLKSNEWIKISRWDEIVEYISETSVFDVFNVWNETQVKNMMTRPTNYLT